MTIIDDTLLRLLASLSESSSSPCNHPVSVNQICFGCLQKIEKLDANGRDFKYIHKGLRLSHGGIHRLRSLATKKLLSRKKLHLVLDIDHTLLHAIKPEAFPGVPDESVKRVGGHLVKLRPLVSDFLEKASSMFEMYLYTLGNRPYAKRVAKLLDPQGKYFGRRIISSDDSPNRIKTLDLVLGEESCVLVVDDTKEVWPNHDRNLILIEKYFFTGDEAKDETETNTPLLKIGDVLSRIHDAYFDGSFCCQDVRELAKMFLQTA